MRHVRLLALFLATAAALPAAAQDPAAAPVTEPAPGPTVPIPAALTAEDMPPIPLALVDDVRPYLESRGAGFAGWDPTTRAVPIDAVRADPAVDPTKVGLTGGSYGGYMCYAAAVQLKNKLTATICIVAISNFVSFLENTNPYRKDLRRVEYGDERDPKQRAKLMAISPLTRVNEISRLMFVITGANDPRVPKSEADQMVAAIRKNGGEAWHLVAADEGHGFRKKANADSAFLAQLVFWKKYLLGE
jgi:pimeloyl-ACP methyl ester carboxylesterase